MRKQNQPLTKPKSVLVLLSSFMKVFRFEAGGHSLSHGAMVRGMTELRTRRLCATLKSHRCAGMPLGGIPNYSQINIGDTDNIQLKISMTCGPFHVLVIDTRHNASLSKLYTEAAPNWSRVSRTSVGLLCCRALPFSSSSLTSISCAILFTTQQLFMVHIYVTMDYVTLLV